jgi:hypothetical protein
LLEDQKTDGLALAEKTMANSSNSGNGDKRPENSSNSGDGLAIAEKVIEETAKYVVGGTGGIAAGYAGALTSAAAANVANAGAAAAFISSIPVHVVGTSTAISGCVVPMGASSFTFGASAFASASAAATPATWAVAVAAINPVVLIGAAAVVGSVGCWFVTKKAFDLFRDR